MRLSHYQTIIISILLVSMIFGQETNPTTYPYGGVPDSSRISPGMKKPPVNLTTAMFDSTHFQSTAHFGCAQFLSTANFRMTKFHNTSDFIGAEFDSSADFTGAEFHSTTIFGLTEYDSTAYFWDTKFHGTTDFTEAEFNSMAIFGLAKFDSMADFWNTEFHSTADFSEAKFNSTAYFERTKFNSTADFRRTNFKKIVLTTTIFNNDVHIGASNKQKFDFTEAILYPDTKIILCDLVELNILTERIKHIAFADHLRYSQKKCILDDLKDSSFKDNKKAQFELDYIFHKSTMFQHPIDTEEMGFQKLINIIYYITMGFGYRPFRLVWWILGIVIIYSVVYVRMMRRQIHGYIFKDEKQATPKSRGKRPARRTGSNHPIDLFIDCLYFSSTMFFTVRLKKDILTDFQSRARWIIISEWLIGILIYLAFLTLSKSGSILHTLKSLFAG